MMIPSAEDLSNIIDAVASWQREGLPVQVHPGDFGWYQRFGSQALASGLRVWTRDGEIAAVGFLDETELIRMAISPDHAADETLAEAVVTDIETTLSDLLPPGTGIVESGSDPRCSTPSTRRHGHPTNPGPSCTAHCQILSHRPR